MLLFPPITLRDDFTASAKRILAARTGHVCSNPGCGNPTTGPGLEANTVINIGVAAHITAASPGTKENPAPRYDESLTPQQRRDISNGLWLCQNCAKLIDSDVQRYTAEFLRKWKMEAEARAFEAVATSAHTPRGPAVFGTELDDVDKDFLRSLALAANEDIETVTKRLLQATQTDIGAFRAAHQWPGNLIQLNLVVREHGRQQGITLAGLANAIGVAPMVSMLSPPGTGKTTTLVQLADMIIATRRAVAGIVPLAEWSGSGEDFLTFLTHRNAFRSFRPQHFQQLAFYGRLVLLIDGWNEVDADARIHAYRQLDALRRDFPLISVVIGTRWQANPFPGPVVEIELLNEDQQLDMARRFPGGSRLPILEQAWRTQGIRELIGIPLYLNALLASTTDGLFPGTKEEVLRAFVAQHENGPDKTEILRKQLLGFHKEMLTGLAAVANSSANVAIPDDKARLAVYNVGQRLAAEGQISACPQPSVALDILVDTHALVRPTNGGSVSFQHQQFQEWYASFEVERLMLSAANDATSRNTLRSGILNWLAWEESVLFACERLSRKDARGVTAVAAAIVDTLGIDPMLSAEMIYRSTDDVWQQIREKVIEFANRWHTPHQVDRAVGFMIATGRADFADTVWPFVSHPNSQVHLTTLRTPGGFRPSVLGPDALKRLTALADKIRGNVVAEIASESGFAGLELAMKVAKAESNPDVVVKIVGALEFRGADRHVYEILNTASSGVWEELAAEGGYIRLKDPAHRARLANLMTEQETADPVHKLSLLAQRPTAKEVGYEIERLIASENYPAKRELAAAAIRRAAEPYPDRVKSALLRRLQSGLPVPNETAELLNDVPTVDEGPFVVAALDEKTPKPLTRFAFGIVGPETVGQMIDQVFLLKEELDAKWEERSEALRTRYWHFMEGIAETRQSSFLEALFKRAFCNQSHRIQMMAELLCLHGRGKYRWQLIVSDEVRNSLVKCFEHWFEVMLTAPDANRHQSADVVEAAGRLPQPEFVPSLHKLLERDLADWARARQEWKQLFRPGPLPPDVTHSYTGRYQQTFAFIGGGQVADIMKSYLSDLVFGLDAARTLAAIWKRGNPSGKKALRFGSWNDFSDAVENRRRKEINAAPTCEFAEEIFSVVRKLGVPMREAAIQQHAIQLATIALRLPHGKKRSEIDTLMALPQPYAMKRGLLSAMAEAGDVIPIRDLIAGVQELLEAAKKEPWVLDKDHGELMPWIELFPFSDDPARVIEMLCALPENIRNPYDLNRLLIAVANSPHDNALAVLKALAKWDDRVVANYRWLDAAFKLQSESGLRLLMDWIYAGKSPDEMQFSERQLADYVKGYPAVRAEILHQFATLPNGTCRSRLKAVLREFSGPEIVLTLVRSYATHGEPYDGTLAHVVRETAVGRRPIPDWPNAYREFSVSLAALRKELFAMVLANDSRSNIAETCLNQIEEIRDERGRISDEPRHPDIDSGKVWPKEAASLRH